MLTIQKKLLNQYVLHQQQEQHHQQIQHSKLLIKPTLTHTNKYNSKTRAENALL